MTEHCSSATFRKNRALEESVKMVSGLGIFRATSLSSSHLLPGKQIRIRPRLAFAQW